MTTFRRRKENQMLKLLQLNRPKESLDVGTKQLIMILPKIRNPQHQTGLTIAASKMKRTEEWVKSTTSQTQEKASKKPTSLKGKKSKRRVRQLIKCEECGKFQNNIWRHMKQIHERHLKDPTEKNKVSKRGYVLRYCPVRNCGAVVERMKDHLVRTHHIARHSRMLDRLMNNVKALTEKYERDIKNSVIKTEKDSTDNSEDDSRVHDKSNETSDGESEQDFRPTQKCKPEIIESEDETDMFGPTQPQLQDKDTESVESGGFVPLILIKSGKK